VDPDTREARAASFSGVAEIYERARPGYPDEAVAWLAGPAPRDVVDVGAGTGKLTRGLVAAGHHVVAVDPSEPMLAQLSAAVPGALTLVGTAERVPLPDGAADVVTVAQAFHWFDHEPALRELARVLRPGGTLGLVWNVRDDSMPWVARLSEILGAERLTAAETEEPVITSGLYGPVEHARFVFSQRLDRASLLALVSSRSYCATRPPDEQAAILEQVGRLFDGEASDGTIILPYVTDAFRATRRAGQPFDV
jgi:SAM-dependent methyltransferase